MFLVQAGVPLIAGVLVGPTVGLLAAGRLGIRPGRAVFAGVAAGALVWLLVSELTWPAVRGFWQRHPSWNAVMTGVALLALTVLLVERAIEQDLARERNRRWRPAARAACEAVLVAVAEPIRVQRAYIFRRASELDGYRSEGSWSHQEPRSAPAVRQAVLAVAPVMTATEQLHGLYTLALTALQAA